MGGRLGECPIILPFAIISNGGIPPNDGSLVALKCQAPSSVLLGTRCFSLPDVQEAVFGYAHGISRETTLSRKQLSSSSFFLFLC